jgi:TrmH family RNA methyltransferase
LTALSFRNEAVQRLRRLNGRRSARQAERRFVVEGLTLLREARDAGAGIEVVFLDAAAAVAADWEVARSCSDRGAQLLEVQPGVIARVSDTSGRASLAAIVDMVDVDLGQLAARRPDLVAVCCEVRDPGNLGTIVRTAGAAGLNGVVCCAGTVDLYNPKTVRASAGSIFHLPVVVSEVVTEVLDEVGRWGLTRWATAARQGCDYAEVDLVQPSAVVLGNEGHGLPGGLDGHVDGIIHIPMAGSAESLNVAGTAAVVCFEAARQRRSAPTRRS